MTDSSSQHTDYMHGQTRTIGTCVWSDGSTEDETVAISAGDGLATFTPSATCPEWQLC